MNRYAVIEVDLDGKINLGVSHWFFLNIKDALEFANAIGSNNPDCKFHVVTLKRK